MDRPSPVILVVDDDADIRALLTALLEDAGYGVVSAPNGAVALSQLQNDPTRFSLVLLDLVMPHIDGYVFRQMQLADPALSHIPVVTLSASAIVRQRGLPEGLDATHFLAKPVDHEGLLALVHFHCGPATA